MRGRTRARRLVLGMIAVLVAGAWLSLPARADEAWDRVAVDGMAAGTRVASAAVLDGALYVSTEAAPGGPTVAEIWRWDGSGGPERIASFPDTVAARLAVVGGRLVVATEGDPVRVLRTAADGTLVPVPVFSRMTSLTRIVPVVLGDELLLQADGRAGPRVYGSLDGVHFWQAVRTGPPDEMVRIATALDPVTPWSRGVVFDDVLYLGARGASAPEVWRTADGMTVDRLPLTSAAAGGAAVPQVVFDRRLYVVVAGDDRLQVLRTQDGLRFASVLRVPGSHLDGDMAVLGDRLVLVCGSDPDAVDPGPIRTWVSADGARWRRAEVSASGERPGSLLADAGTLYLSASDAAGDRVWTSADGRRWAAVAAGDVAGPAGSVARLTRFEGSVVLLPADLSTGWWVRRPPGGAGAPRVPSWPWLVVALGAATALAWWRLFERRAERRRRWTFRRPRPTPRHAPGHA